MLPTSHSPVIGKRLPFTSSPISRPLKQPKTDADEEHCPTQEELDGGLIASQPVSKPKGLVLSKVNSPIAIIIDL